MGAVEYAVALIVLLCVVALVVLRPLLAEEPGTPDAGALEELEAAKEAKYREIRDAELDVKMGKLSEEDHRSIDRELRAEAIEILEKIDRLEGKSPGS